MNTLFNYIDPEILFFAGMIGLLLAIITLFVFTKKRILKLLGRKNIKAPGITASLRNLVVITFFIAVSGVLIFFSLFYRAYHRFTYEEPVAQIEVIPVEDKMSIVKLKQFVNDDSSSVEEYQIHGDQWMIEGDILKWDGIVNFLGLHTRYRLTRIRGRYIKTSEELSKTSTVYSLIEDEENPFWSVMYDVGHSLPLVSSVYGNASYQMSNSEKKFNLFVSTSGFVVRVVE